MKIFVYSHLATESDESDSEIASQIHRNLQRSQLSRIQNEQSFVRSPLIRHRMNQAQNSAKDDTPSPILNRSITKVYKSPVIQKSQPDEQTDDMWLLATHALAEVSRKKYLLIESPNHPEIICIQKMINT